MTSSRASVSPKLATPTLAVCRTRCPPMTSGRSRRVSSRARRFARGLDRHLRQQHAELVAPEPRDVAELSQIGGDQGADAADQLVPGGVSERVVDVLEPVDVDQHHDAVHAVDRRRGDRSDEPVLEVAPVEQAGQPIVIGEVLQLRLMPLALADVADRVRDQHPVHGLQRAEADLDRELGAVRPAPEELEDVTAGLVARAGQAAVLMRAMLAAHARGHEVADVLPDHLRPRVAEDLLGGDIDQLHVPVQVDDDHRIRRRLQQRAELALRPEQQPVATHHEARDAQVPVADRVQDPANDLAEGCQASVPAGPVMRITSVFGSRPLLSGRNPHGIHTRRAADRPP
jgi:hypothetical protein